MVGYYAVGVFQKGVLVVVMKIDEPKDVACGSFNLYHIAFYTQGGIVEHV